ncbi:class I SAM-dependent methyltransferase [Candidatus Falkowbacteria bacterium]|nr:class I SAM-dependent methyltransferase [Candidatus Falkowbacteria bacterium]
MSFPGLDKIEFEEPKCIFCKEKQSLTKVLDAPDRLNKLPGTFSLVKCGNCGLVFQSPRPKEEFIGNFYPDELHYFIPNQETVKPIKAWLETKVLINFFGYTNLGKGNFFSKVLFLPAYYYFFRHKTIPHYVPNGKILEIGCSHGAFLAQLKKWGWDVVGIEMNAKAADYARNTRGFEVLTGSITDIDLPSNSFDAIIAEMVMEHLYDPQAVVARMSNSLKKNGELIFSIPFFEGAEYGLFKDFSYGLHLPNHIYFFNKSNIAQLLNDNFDRIKIFFHHFDRDFIASAKYKYEDNKKFIWKLISQSKAVKHFLIRPLVFILSVMQKTSRVTVRAYKKDQA